MENSKPEEIKNANAAEEETEEKLLTYKGRPLIRKGSRLYYGFMNDSHIVVLNILESTEQAGIPVATKVRFDLIATDTLVRKVIKKGEKNGLYDAMDVASIWLERALSAANKG